MFGGEWVGESVRFVLGLGGARMRKDVSAERGIVEKKGAEKDTYGGLCDGVSCFGILERYEWSFFFPRACFEFWFFYFSTFLIGKGEVFKGVFFFR